MMLTVKKFAEIKRNWQVYPVEDLIKEIEYLQAKVDLLLGIIREANNSSQLELPALDLETVAAGQDGFDWQNND